ncbi:hypothetical protein EU527_07690 [Candidatus Thorarchaeota archaeon]|nr:MAG: hypothetical protein EU527_07690 [Candidatus Thorarchaeota archaeon]
MNEKSKLDNEFLVADFASGEHDRVPSFFIKILSKLADITERLSDVIFVYCIDIHSLRLDSLLGKLEESNLLNRVRVVKAKLESMDEQACLRPAMTEFLEENPDTLIWLDDFLIKENRFPTECFDIGILNNDIIGYMMEYYTEYSDAVLGFTKISNLMKRDGLLIVTMPCSLYVVDNVSILQDMGFEFAEGVDIDLETQEIRFFEVHQDYHSFSRLNHYTYLIFKKIKNNECNQLI